jgi:Doubled CXXCH motif (Paired_CXXCH_1)
MFWRTAATAGACLVALALGGAAGDAFAGIANTKHNLGSTGIATNNRVSDTAEVCVFCHTPHGGSVSATTESPPLWNKRIPTGATYTTYEQLNSASIDGQILAVGSVSVACLSCHDGTQAMDNIINAPGSGGLTADGGGVNGLAYTWTAGSTTAPTVNTFGMLTGGAALIGTDLRNDHPIGIQYCGGGIVNGAGTCVDKDFVAPQFRTITTQGGATISQYWVDTKVGTPNTRDKTDMLLYARQFTAGNGPSVECGSCHDPHVQEGENGAGATFLRVANTGSAVCLSCHVK